MIDGIGIDVVDIERFKSSLERTPGLLEKLFTSNERTKPIHSLAARFAAKEAFSKAVGTGFKRGVFMKDIGVVNSLSGAPTLALTGGAKARLETMTPAGYAARIHLTLTDDHPWAQAFVIIEAIRPVDEDIA